MRAALGFAIAALFALPAPLAAQNIVWAAEELSAPVQPGEIRLESIPAGTPDEEIWFHEIVPETVSGGTQMSVRNVTVPTLVPVLPVGGGGGAAMIVAPGGGFLGLAIEKEGWDVARWLANNGVAAFVLKYRVIPSPMEQAEWTGAMGRAMRGEAPAPFAMPADTPGFALADGLAALRHVREHAADYGIDPLRVGFMGFSAGGFLTRSVIEHGGDDAPDFAAPIYPGMGPLALPDNPPPLFVTIAADDFLLAQVEGFPLIDTYRAAGAPVEFHLLASGGHGFGLGRAGEPSEGWPAQMLRWMRDIGMLEERDAEPDAE